jgi:hypothetical protein
VIGGKPFPNAIIVTNSTETQTFNAMKLGNPTKKCGRYAFKTHHEGIFVIFTDSFNPR